ncbi:hypothetical protein Q4E93_18720 [Flavitalea sp. BT771]|uniref:hypothetical protein n=1 Tax=Flavitalea sp. BT771 TaxID=3063329 RepID=UPI0026E31808|nr:hypothetical protein [Flavitalea sp. BT771]MDO6432646.1 hypothetical protein [Flavitalea sp. BT771]MDV6222078.1 hypothetical protein [Flavitalea sp. BT771]
MDRFEIAENPSILAEREVPISEVKLFGFKLFDECFLLKIDEVDSITLVKLPVNVKQLFGGDGKNWLYEIDGHRQTFTFKQQFDSVMRHGGCLHMKNKVTYIIDEQKITGMKLYNNVHGFYKSTPKEKIENIFGKADKIEEIFFEVDGSLASSEFTYFDRPMSISVEAWNNEISTIHIGRLPFKLSWQK